MWVQQAKNVNGPASDGGYLGEITVPVADPDTM